ncbi:glucuronosyltransferase [Caenorhabditis elegans]|nr:glucuronosyltransferase [Caenorhabditis elegans]CDH92992.1 glucuronosyltransferase [Caenorhabditis elegans]|eukprot:NP_001294295.1 UDP-GlucuronosylTransferase [Caenorhabditis elegans]
MQTMGKLADILVEAGHDVTFLMPVDVPIPQNGTELAKVVLVPTTDAINEIMGHAMKSGAVANLWTHSANSKQGIMWSTDMIGQVSYHNTKNLIDNKALVQQMKDEKFDIGITELFDFSGLAFFEVIGLKNVMGAHTTSVFEGTLMATGAPILPSFVPASQTFTDDSGSILSRLNNLYMTYWSYQFQNKIQSFAQKALDEHYEKGKAPKIWNLVSDITWFFVNSDPIFDFPKPLPQNIVEIAGISVPEIKPVGKEWDEILSKRSKNVLVSFGSIASPTTMPEAVKKSIVDAFAAFPDVTFIWKYDDTESKLTAHLDNVHIVKWMPQNDLLADKRISMFWTHGGMGSLMESAQKSVPLVVVPIFGDQMRNAQIAKRHGVALIYDKMDLSNTKKLIGALKEVLENPEYKKSAELLARILATERFSPRQKIIDTVEMAGRFGQMPRWTSAGKEFSFLKYFNLDLVIIAVFIFFLSIVSTVLLIRHLLAKLGFSGDKEKSE